MSADNFSLTVTAKNTTTDGMIHFGVDLDDDMFMMLKSHYEQFDEQTDFPSLVAYCQQLEVDPDDEDNLPLALVTLATIIWIADAQTPQELHGSYSIVFDGLQISINRDTTGAGFYDATMETPERAVLH